jgi:hypothetical protein
MDPIYRAKPGLAAGVRYRGRRAIWNPSRWIKVTVAIDVD